MITCLSIALVAHEYKSELVTDICDLNLSQIPQVVSGPSVRLPQLLTSAVQILGIVAQRSTVRASFMSHPLWEHCRRGALQM